MDILDKDVLTMTSSQISSLTIDARAMLKRVAFCKVSQSLLTAEAVAKFRANRRINSCNKFAEIYTGDLEIP